MTTTQTTRIIFLNMTIKFKWYHSNYCKVKTQPHKHYYLTFITMERVNEFLCVVYMKNILEQEKG
jgi:hypothetical protein